MATWSLIETVTFVTARAIASDGNDTIYITSVLGDNVYEYNHSTDTITQIADTTSFSADSTFNNEQNGTNCIVYFSGNLYVCSYHNVTKLMKVYRYNGGGISDWDIVLSYSYTDLYISMTMFASDTQIAMVDSEGTVHYSNDGDTWNNTTVSSWNTSVASWPGGSRNNNELGNSFAVSNVDGGSNDYLLEYQSNGSFTETNVSSSDLRYYRTSGKNNHWRYVASWEYSSTLTGSYSAAGTQPKIIPFSINPFYDYGLTDIGGSVKFHLWTGSDFDAGETVFNGTWNLSSGSVLTIVTFSDGETLILRQTTALGSTVEIYKRSEPLPAPVTTDELRYIDFMADDTNLYITANENQVLQLQAIDLQTLVLSVLQSFGASTYAELDSRTYGISPKTIPNLSGILWLYGNDGDDNQLALSVDYGANFDIISSPLTTDFVSGLHINMFQPDDIVITVFRNTGNILYVNSPSFEWVTVDNYAANILVSERSPIVTTALIVASDAGNLSITPNLGNDFVDITSTLPQVNVIKKAF